MSAQVNVCKICTIRVVAHDAAICDTCRTVAHVTRIVEHPNPQFGPPLAHHASCVCGWISGDLTGENQYARAARAGRMHRANAQVQKL